MLVNPKDNCVACPEHIALIGGGRWARVLLEVLCSLVPISVKISAHSPRNVDAMSQWVSARGLDRRIHVCSDYPKVVPEKTGAVIVANAAHDHEKAIEWALTECLPVLVEKPVTLSLASTQRMADLANKQKMYLATAHVFLFASYIEAFSKLVFNERNIVSIRVLWSDPQSENRYGEAKSYDPGLPIYADLLPHILSIVGAFKIGQAQLCENFSFFKGGAHLKINLVYGQIPCVIELIRNGNLRQRIIEVTTEKSKITLDFGIEPGIIYTDASELCGDPVWDINPKPVAKMLLAFLQGAAGGVYDERLDNSIGLLASQLIDQTKPLYHAALSLWLNHEFEVFQDCISSDLRYALTEILQMKYSNSAIRMEQRIVYIYQNIKEHILILCNKPDQRVEDVMTLINNIIESPHAYTR